MEINLIEPKIERLFNDQSNIISQILKNRGITETADEFFNLSWDDVQSPYDLDFIKEAAERILTAANDYENIAILVDPDMDGFTSAAELTNYLKKINAEIAITHVFHEGKEHGLSDKVVMKEIRDFIKPDLLIIPDASGTATQYTALTDLGIDIVVLDHHEDTEKAPNDKVIIVNNQQSVKYKNKKLSGAGIVWQLLRVIDELSNNDFSNDDIDIMAAGLIADVMSLQERETRFLVREGLKLSNVRNPFMILYAQENSFSMGSAQYNPKKIGWYLGPLFNAVVRVGDKLESKMLFSALLSDAGTKLVADGKRGRVGEFVPLVKEALRQATNAKSRQTRRQNKLTEMLENYIAEHSLHENQTIIIKIDEFTSEERALSGVVANKLLDYYKRPVLLGYRKKSEDGEDENVYFGSLRAPDTIPCFKNFKTQCNESGLFDYVSGHESAAGFSFKGDNFDAIVEYFNKKFAGQSIEISYDVDYVFEANDPNLADVIIALEQYEDWWGKGIEEPVIAVRNAMCNIHNMQLMSPDKNPTLKFKLQNDVAAIKFHSSKAEFDSFCKRGNDLLPPEIVNNFTLIGGASVNRWRDTVTPQLVLKYYQHNGQALDF